MASVDFLHLQLADSAFPSSGFVHSAGLEAAFQFGQAASAGSVVAFIRGLLAHAAKSALPFVAAAARTPHDLPALDVAADVRMIGPSQNRASRAQGRTFAATSVASFGTVASFFEASSTAPPCMHHAPVFGAIVGLLGVVPEDAAALFLHGSLRGTLGAGVRLGVLGPHEAQEIQHSLVPLAARLAEEGAARSPAEAASASPLHDLYPMLHARLYSRLFQS